jgi:PAS domain S-box-containing protein
MKPKTKKRGSGASFLEVGQTWVEKKPKCAGKASSDMFKEVMDSLEALVYVIDIKTHKVIFANRHLQDTFDVSVGNICWQSIHSQQTGPCQFCNNEMLLDRDGKPGLSSRFEEQNTANGRWYDMINRSVYWSDGKLVRITIATDITKRKQMEESLYESNEKLNTLLKNSPDIIQVIDKYFSILYTNEIVKESIPKEILGRNLLDRIDPEYHIEFGETFKHVIDQRETHSFEYKDILGKWWETEIAHITIGNNNNCAMLITHDINERKLMEQSLLESNEKLNTLLKHSPDTISVINERFTILYTNKALRKNSIIKTLGGNFLKNIHPDYRQSFEKLFWEVVEMKRPKVFEFKDTGGKWWESKVAQLAVGCNSNCVMLITSNIEDRKKTETYMQQAQVELQKRIKERTDKLEVTYQQLVQSEKMAALGILISGIAHEINNPNSFISFNIPILQDYIGEMLPIIDEYATKNKALKIAGMDYLEFREDVLKLIQNMEHGSQRINTTVSHLKEFAASEQIKEFQLIDLRTIIEKGIALCRNKVEKLVRSFEIELNETPAEISTIPQYLEQILINLLINAAQSADKVDSWVKLTVFVHDCEPQYTCIDIVDNGCGIKKKNLSKIFQPFFTSKRKKLGIGLGLNITAKLVEDIGGKIEVESKPSVGSRFRLVLPILK